MRYIVLVLTGLLLFSCSANRAVKPDLEKIGYRELLEYNQQWQNKIINIKGEAQITLDSPQYSGNFSADIIVDGRDSMLIAVTGPLGISVGKVFIARERFVFYNQLMNQFFTGSRDDFSGTNFFQFPLDLNEMHSVFTARNRFEILKRDVFDIRDQQYYLEASNGEQRFKIWFDPTYLLIRKIEYLDEEQLLYYKTYDQFREVDGVVFPMAVSFVRPDQKQGVSLYYNEIEINRPADPASFDIKISDSARQIDFPIQD